MTWTGFRAACSGRTRCDTPARSPFGLRPEFARSPPHERKSIACCRTRLLRRTIVVPSALTTWLGRDRLHLISEKHATRESHRRCEVRAAREQCAIKIRAPIPARRSAVRRRRRSRACRAFGDITRRDTLGPRPARAAREQCPVKIRAQSPRGDSRRLGGSVGERTAAFGDITRRDTIGSRTVRNQDSRASRRTHSRGVAAQPSSIGSIAGARRAERHPTCTCRVVAVRAKVPFGSRSVQRPRATLRRRMSQRQLRAVKLDARSTFATRNSKCSYHRSRPARCTARCSRSHFQPAIAASFAQ